MKKCLLHALVCLLLVPSICFSQTIETPHFKGAVYDDKGEPVKGITVLVSDAKRKVITDAQGFFTAEFESLEPGTPITISLETKDWIIYSPLLGKHVIQNKDSKEIFPVKIARRGSAILYSSEVLTNLFIEQQIRVNSYLGKYPSPEEQEQKEDDVIIDYSKQARVDLDFLRKRIALWQKTKEIDPQNNNAGAHRINSVKEYSNGNFLEAIKEREAAAAITKADLDSSKKDLIEDYKFTAKVFYESRDYLNALHKYESLERLFLEEKASGEFSKEDRLDTKFWIATTKMQLGNIVEGQDAINYLTQSRDEYEQLLTFYDTEPLRQKWASIRINLGGVLGKLGNRSGKDSRTYLNESKTVLEIAIEVFKNKNREEFARAKNNLSVTLFELGKRTAGKEGMDYLRSSKEAIMEALEIYAGKRPPQWSLAKNTLGNTLRVLGERTKDQAGIEILKDSRQAYKDALTVLSEKSYSWARANGSLGITLQILGDKTKGDTAYLTESKDALEKALTVFTRGSYPQQWAITTNTLGGTLGLLGERTKGSKGVELLEASADIFYKVLKVHKENPFSQDWGNAQNNLGVTFQKIGQRTEGTERIGSLEKSKDYLRTALTVFNKKDFAYQYSTINNDLGFTLQLLSESEEGEKSRDYLIESAKAYLEASTKFTDNSPLLKAFDIYHNKLFLFDQSLSINKDWLNKNKDDIEVGVRFAENLLTTDQRTDCDKQSDSLLTKDNIAAENIIVLKTIQIIGLLESRQSEKITPKLDSIMDQISTQTPDFKVCWNFDGTKYFINQNKELTPYRTWLLELISSVSNNDRDTILQGLKTLRKDFKN